MENKDIRWIQRFDNFSKANAALQRALEIAKPSEVERGGIVQFFEFSFELAWKTLKDYLNEKGEEANFPREVIKKSFAHGLLDQGDIWMDMLEKRNLMSHTYDEKNAKLALTLINEKFAPQLLALKNKLSSLIP